MSNNIYIEDVIIVNFLTSFVICALTQKSLKNKNNKVLFCVCVFLCVTSSVLSKYVNLNGVLFVFFKLFIGFILSLFLSYKTSIKNKIGTYVVFMFNTFLMGGICYAVLFLSGKNIFIENVNSNLLLIIVLLSSIFYYYLFSKLLKVFYSKQRLNCYCYQVTLTINGIKKTITGFLDSGNNLTFQNLPVCIINFETAIQFYKNLSILDLMLKQNVLIRGAEYIKYSTVSGQSSMLIFKPDILEVKIKNDYIKFNCYIGISLNNISSSNSYSILLNSKLF